MSVKVKICGITTPAQAEVAQKVGVDALGLVLYEKSSRYVEACKARSICDVVDKHVKTIALLVNATKKQVEQTIEELNPDFLQFHGDETAEFCNQFNFPFIRAIRMQDHLHIATAIKGYRASGGFLFDAWENAKYGGTGSSFDWGRLPQIRDFRLVLAGGLTIDNVAQAVAMVSPDMVDVSGGVESSPGVKDPHLMAEFIRRAKAVP